MQLQSGYALPASLLNSASHRHQKPGRIPLIDRAKLFRQTEPALKLLRIMLYPEDEVREIASLKAKAAKRLGVSTGSLGVGVFGAPSWEFFGEAAAVSLLSSVVTKVMNEAAQKEAMFLLDSARRISESLEGNGFLFDGADLINSQHPHPHIWHVITGREEKAKDVGHMGPIELEEFCRLHHRKTTDVAYGRLVITEERRYVHHGGWRVYNRRNRYGTNEYSVGTCRCLFPAKGRVTTI